MLGPFTEERQQQLLDSAGEFTKIFAKEYSKMFALAMLQRIEEEVKGEEDERRLQYRDWSSIERPDLFHGECYMRQGEGPGAFGKWKNVFLTEMQDYNIAVYPDKKAYDSGKKKPMIIRVAGYSVQRDPSWYYSWVMRDMTAGLGITQTELEVLTKMSPYSWALAHPWRTNYVFQLHKGKSPVCGCFGGNTIEPDDVGAEFSDERGKLLDVFERCVSYASSRDVDSVSGKGFDLTVGKMASKLENLSGFEDEGLESEILVDMLLQECLSPMKDDMLHDLKGPVSLRLVAWYKTRGLVQVSIQKVADPAWGQMAKGAEQLGQKMEPKVKQGIEPILKVKEDVKQKIRDKLTDKMGECLAKYISPHIAPLFKAFDKPMTTGFTQSKDVFRQQVAGNLPADVRQRNLYLDNIPRSYQNICEMTAVADEVVAPLQLLKRSSEEIFGDLDPNDLKNQALQSLLETLDAAVFTLECKMDEGGQQGDHLNKLLQDYDHDVIVAKSNFVTAVVKSILIGGFRKAISPLADPVIESLDGLIPEDLLDFISVAAIFEELVDLFVGEPIQKMVEGAYPRPK